MAEQTILVGVVIVRRRLDNPWVDHAWTALAVLPAVPPIAPWTVLAENAGERRVYAGPFAMALHRSDTAQYRENLLADQPSLWVALRRTGREREIEVVAVTADPSEGEMLTEAGDDIVEPVPMPPETAAALAGFVEAHHVERVFYKRKRDVGGNEGTGRRGGDEPPDEDRS